MFMPGVSRFVAVSPPRRNAPERHAVLFHRSDLHIARWMPSRHIHRFKIIPFRFQFRSVHDHKSHTDADIFHFPSHLCQNVESASLLFFPGNRRVKNPTVVLALFPSLQIFFNPLKHFYRFLFHLVGYFTDLRSFCLRHIFYFFNQFCQLTGSAGKIFFLQIIQLLQSFCALKLINDFLFNFLEFFLQHIYSIIPSPTKGRSSYINDGGMDMILVLLVSQFPRRIFFPLRTKRNIPPLPEAQQIKSYSTTLKAFGSAKTKNWSAAVKTLLPAGKPPLPAGK